MSIRSRSMLVRYLVSLLAVGFVSIGLAACFRDAVSPPPVSHIGTLSLPNVGASVGDADGDEVNDDVDNCPVIANTDQRDSDANGIGDLCDDVDADGILSIVDNCVLVANPDQANADGDALGDACDPDNDNDGISNEDDNCPVYANSSQDDFDGDGSGDACDTDDDGDSVLDVDDACWDTALGTPVNSQGCNLVTYNFSGFFQPVASEPDVNSVKAGSAVPVRFSLGADQGLDIFEAGSPSSVSYSCDASPSAVIDQTVAATASQLNYSAATGLYTYIWKTDKAWAGGCRQLRIKLADGTTHTASFSFTR